MKGMPKLIYYVYITTIINIFLFEERSCLINTRSHPELNRRSCSFSSVCQKDMARISKYNNRRRDLKSRVKHTKWLHLGVVSMGEIWVTCQLIRYCYTRVQSTDRGGHHYKRTVYYTIRESVYSAQQLYTSRTVRYGANCVAPPSQFSDYISCLFLSSLLSLFSHLRDCGSVCTRVFAQQQQRTLRVA